MAEHNQYGILKGPVIFNQLVTKPVKGKQEFFAVENNARLQSSIWFMHADIAAKIIAGTDLLSKVLKLVVKQVLNHSAASLIFPDDDCWEKNGAAQKINFLK